MATPAVQRFEVGAEMGKVEQADAQVRNRVLMCSQGYMSRHDSQKAQVKYISPSTVLRLRTADTGLEKHLEHCVGAVAYSPLAGSVVIGSQPVEESHDRP